MSNLPQLIADRIRGKEKVRKIVPAGLEFLPDWIENMLRWESSLSTGPLIDGNQGYHIYRMVVKYAEERGFSAGPYSQEDEMEVADEAIEFLNTYFPIAGAEWGYHPDYQDFGIWSVEEEVEILIAGSPSTIPDDLIQGALSRVPCDIVVRDVVRKEASVVIDVRVIADDMKQAMEQVNQALVHIGFQHILFYAE